MPPYSHELGHVGSQNWSAAAPQAACTTGCKARTRRSCEQAPAHTSMRPSAIQGETAKGR